MQFLNRLHSENWDFSIRTVICSLNAENIVQRNVHQSNIIFWIDLIALEFSVPISQHILTTYTVH